MNSYRARALPLGLPSMLDITADPPAHPCYPPVLGSGIMEFRPLDPDLFSSRARALRRERFRQLREVAGGALLVCCRFAADSLLGKSKTRAYPPRDGRIRCRFAADAANDRRRA